MSDTDTASEPCVEAFAVSNALIKENVAVTQQNTRGYWYGSLRRPPCSFTRLILVPLALVLGSCASTSTDSVDDRELLAIATTAGPAPSGDVVAIVYKDGSALHVEPLPPQPLICLTPPGAVGCPVSRVYDGFANITPQQQADAEWFYRSADLDRNWVLVVGHLATVTVRDHRTGTTSQQTWFMVGKLHLLPTGDVSSSPTRRSSSTPREPRPTPTSSRSAAASSRPRAAHIAWTGLAAYGSGGPSSVDDMFVTGQTDFTRSPLPLAADEYFVRQTR